MKKLTTTSNGTLVNREFQIYKKGKTTGKITILSKVGEPFKKEDKIKKYLTLGYSVYDMNGNKY